MEVDGSMLRVVRRDCPIDLLGPIFRFLHTKSRAPGARLTRAGKGALDVGEDQDLVMLDKSPLEVDRMAIKDMRYVENIEEGGASCRAPRACGPSTACSRPTTAGPSPAFCRPVMACARSLLSGRPRTYATGR